MADTAAGKKIHVAVQVIFRDFVFIVSGNVVGSKGGRCGMGQTGGGDDAGGQAVGFGFFDQGFHVFSAGILTDYAFVGFDAGGKGRTGGGRVCDQGVGGIGAVDTGNVEAVHQQPLGRIAGLFLKEKFTELSLGRSQAVADKVEYVLGLAGQCRQGEQ